MKCSASKKEENEKYFHGKNRKEKAVISKVVYITCAISTIEKEKQK